MAPMIRGAQEREADDDEADAASHPRPDVEPTPAVHVGRAAVGRAGRRAPATSRPSRRASRRRRSDAAEPGTLRRSRAARGTVSRRPTTTREGHRARRRRARRGPLAPPGPTRSRRDVAPAHRAASRTGSRQGAARAMSGSPKNRVAKKAVPSQLDTVAVVPSMWAMRAASMPPSAIATAGTTTNPIARTSEPDRRHVAQPDPRSEGTRHDRRSKELQHGELRPEAARVAARQVRQDLDGRDRRLDDERGHEGDEASPERRDEHVGGGVGGRHLPVADLGGGRGGGLRGCHGEHLMCYSGLASYGPNTCYCQVARLRLAPPLAGPRDGHRAVPRCPLT